MKISAHLKSRLKKYLLAGAGLTCSFVLFVPLKSKAQASLEIIKSNSHIGGYHIKCNGMNSGNLEALPDFGNAPYTFLWNTGETTALISDKPAGIYYVNVTDANNVMHTDTFELKQPRAFAIESKLSDYNGYNISSFGTNDGVIELLASGGTPPYQYHWSNGDSVSVRKLLHAGTYNFTVIDANQCATNSTIVLTAPSPIQLSFSNVHGTTCFEGKDGKATLNVSGGLGDFSFVWKNGNFSSSPDDLPSGYNTVRIYEQGKAILDTGITIPEPAVIESQFNLSNYNGFNVSCVDCYNGNIITSITGGIGPYSYHWNDANNSTTANLSNLTSGEYKLTITDANGCKAYNSVNLTIPPQKDWSRLGNTNIDPAQFIGSTDGSPLIFKVNNEEVMEMKIDTVNFHSKIRLSNIDTTAAYNNDKLIGIDEEGNLRAYERGEILPGNPAFPPGCIDCGCSPVIGWGKPAAMINGVAVASNTNDIVKCPADGNVGIGTTIPEANSKLDVHGEIAISGERLNVAYNGNVGVGTSSPTDKLHLFGGNFKVSCPWDNVNPVFFVDFNAKNAGVGTAQPRGKFEIKMSEFDNINFGAMRTEASGWGTSFISFNAYRLNDGTWKSTGDGSNSGAAVIYSNALGDLLFTNIDGAGVPNEILSNDDGIKQNTKMTLSKEGVLGIGINPRNNYDLLSYKLVVDGNIKCKKLRVDLQNWGDYVFDSNYALMDLASIEAYIEKNNHLPGMPDAAQIEKEGIDIAEIIKMQQIKIEELTLLLIQMQKQINLTQKN